MFRKVVFVSFPMLSAAAISVKEEKLAAAAVAVVAEPTKKRLSDLPIYDPPSAGKCTHCKAHGKEMMSPAAGVRGTIEQTIGLGREAVFDTYKYFQWHTHRFDDFYQTGKAHTTQAIDYLNQPENSLPRAGAIAMGSTAGFIWGLRGGFIRRVVYTAIGGGVIASICYPADAEIYAQKALAESKSMVKIGYNFLYGIKPGDEANFPKIPGNMNELMDAVADLFATTKDKITNAVVTTNDKK